MAYDGSIKIDTKLDTSGLQTGLSKLGGIARSGLKATMTAIGAVGTGLLAAGGFATKAGIEFESAFAGIRKTVDATEEQFAQLEAGILSMSKRIPQSAAELSSIGEAAGQLGIKTENIEGFIETMANLGVATNMTSEEAATSLARLANITQMPQTEFNKLGSVIVALGNNLATTESEITAMGLRIAGAANQVGMSEAEIMAFSGALSSVGIEAEAGGTAFSTLISKMNLATAQGGKDLQNFASVAGMSADEFKQSFEQDASGAILSFVKGLANVNESGGSAIAVLDEIGLSDIRMRDAMLRAAGASDVFSEALNIGTQAWDENTALTKEAEQRYKTMESRIQLLKNGVTNLGIAFYQSTNENIGGAVDLASDYINQLEDAFKNNGIEGLVEKLGDVFADLTTHIAKSAPKMIDAAVKMINSFVKGIQKNAGKIAEGAAKIVKALVDGIMKLIPTIISTAKKIVSEFAKELGKAVPLLKPFTGAIQLIAGNLKTLIPLVLSVAAAMKTWSIIKTIQSTVNGITAAWKGATAALAAHEAAQRLMLVTSNGGLTLMQSLVGVLTGKISLLAVAQGLATKAQTALNVALNSNIIGVVVVAVAALAAGLTALFHVINSSAKKAQEQIQSNADSVTSFSEAINNAKGDVADYNKILSDTGKTAEGIDDEIKQLEDNITKALSEAIASQKGLRDQDIKNIEQYMEDMRRLQDEKLGIYRTQQITVLRKMQTESGEITQEGQAKYIAEAKTALEESNKIAEEQYNTEVAIIENTYKAKNEIGSEGHKRALIDAKSNYESLIAENQKYYNETTKTAETNIRSLTSSQEKQWSSLAGLAAKFSTTGKSEFEKLNYSWSDFFHVFDGANNIYAQELAQMDLDTANALLGMALTVKESGQPIDTETQAILTNIVTSFANLPGSMDETGQQALLGIISGMETQIPGLQNASEMSATEICNVLAETFGIQLPETKNIFQSLYEDLPKIASEQLNKIVENIKSWAKETKDNMEKGIKEAIDKVKEKFNNLPEDIGYALGSAARKVVEFIDDVKKWFSELPGSVKKWMTETWEKVKTWASDTLSTVQTEVPKITNNIAKWFQELPGKLKEIGYNMIQGLWNGVKNAWDKVSGAFTGLIDGIKRGFTGPKGFDEHSPSKWAKGVGSYLLEGLQIGMEKQKKNTIKSLTGLLTQTKEAGKKVMGIRSPSTVMRDEIGAQIDRGIAEGIRENSDTVLDEFNTLLDALKDKRELNIISEEEYHTQLEALTREHLDENSKEWREHMTEVYQYQQETYEKSINAAEDAYTKIADTAKSKLDEILKAQESFKEKMTSGSLIGTIYSETDGSRTQTGTYLNDPNYSAKAMVAYAEQIKKIQALAGDNAGFISQILREMDLATGQQFLNTLLNMEPGKLDAFLKGLTENAVSKLNNMENSEKLNFADMLFYMSGTDKKSAVQMITEQMEGITSEAAAAQTIADLLWEPDNAQLKAETGQSFYAEFGESLPADFWQFGEDAAANFAKSFVDKASSEETQTEIKAAGEAAGDTFVAGVSESLSKETMKAELEKTFGTVPDSFFDLGEDSADSFGEGFTSRLKAIFANMQNAVAGMQASMSPVLVGGGTVGNISTYNASYNFYGSGQTVSQQLQASRQHSEITRMRGN